MFVLGLVDRESARRSLVSLGLLHAETGQRVAA